MNPGSAFGIGNTMYVAGIGTTTAANIGAHSAAKITVTKIDSNIGNVIRITGVTSESYNNIMIYIVSVMFMLVLPELFTVIR